MAHSSGATFVAHLNASRAASWLSAQLQRHRQRICQSITCLPRIVQHRCRAQRGGESTLHAQPTLGAERLHLRKLDAAADQGRVVECNAQALASDVHTAARRDFELHDLWYQDLVIL